MEARLAAGCALGIDIGGTATKIGIVTPGGIVKSVDSVPTIGDPNLFLKRVFDTAMRLRATLNLEIVGVGIAVAGFLDENRSTMTFNPNIPWLEHFPLQQAFGERFQLPVLLEVDSNAAALAEYRYGAGRGARRLLCLCIGTGVGGAMVVDGALVRLAHQCIGDPGHVLVLPDGPECTSGCHGCAEALVSAPAIMERACSALASGSHSVLSSLHYRPSVKEIIEAGRQGDALARKVLGETGVWLGAAIGSLAAIFCPDRVVVAGGVAEADGLLLKPAEARFRSQTGVPYHTGVELCKAYLGWQAGMVGAASAVWVGR
jgi:glucokinase